MGIIRTLQISTKQPSKMGKIMKKGRVVILLAGRHSGKKAVIVKQIDEGKKNRKFGHALVAGVDRTPKKISKRMSQKKLDRKMKIKPFVKYVNYTHLLATRFTCKEDFDFKSIEGAGERQSAADFIFKRLRF